MFYSHFFCFEGFNGAIYMSELLNQVSFFIHFLFSNEGLGGKSKRVSVFRINDH